MKLIVGLGNPGNDYLKTKHNVGFMCIDKVLDKLDIKLDKNKFNGDYIQGIINNQKFIILKPQTYMNLSGECVVQFVNYFKINLEDILVIYDDMDLEISQFKIKLKGASNGQKGIENIMNHLHTRDIARIRIGIGRDKNISTRNYVLTTFNEQQLIDLNKTLDITSDATIYFINNSIDLVMNKYNIKKNSNK